GAAPGPPVPVRRPAPVGAAKPGLWGLQGNRVAAAAAVLALVLIPASFWAARRSSSAGAVSEAAMVTGSQRKAARLIATRAVEESPALSPDGRRLAYVGDAGGHKQVFVRTLGEGEDRAVSRDSADELQPTWSTDGQHVAFVRATRAGLQGSDVGDSVGSIRKGDIWAVNLVSGE